MQFSFLIVFIQLLFKGCLCLHDQKKKIPIREGYSNLQKEMLIPSDPLTTFFLNYPGKTKMILGNSSHNILISGWQYQISEVVLGHFLSTISAGN